jgi:hypothetical protein
MDINTLAAWGEFLGGIAVVVSLIYLAGQIRQNSRLMRVSTAAVASSSIASLTGSLADAPELARIYREGWADRAALSVGDRYRFDAIMMQRLSGAMTMYHLWREGAFLPALWEYHRRGLRVSLSQPGTQEWWSEWGGTFDDDFRNLVDGLIHEGEATG